MMDTDKRHGHHRHKHGDEGATTTTATAKETRAHGASSEENDDQRDLTLQVQTDAAERHSRKTHHHRHGHEHGSHGDSAEGKVSTTAAAQAEISITTTATTTTTTTTTSSKNSDTAAVTSTQPSGTNSAAIVVSNEAEKPSPARKHHHHPHRNDEDEQYAPVDPGSKSSAAPTKEATGTPSTPKSLVEPSTKPTSLTASTTPVLVTPVPTTSASPQISADTKKPKKKSRLFGLSRKSEKRESTKSSSSKPPTGGASPDIIMPAQNNLPVRVLSEAAFRLLCVAVGCSFPETAAHHPSREKRESAGSSRRKSRSKISSAAELLQPDSGLQGNSGETIGRGASTDVTQDDPTTTNTSENETTTDIYEGSDEDEEEAEKALEESISGAFNFEDSQQPLTSAAGSVLSTSDIAKEQQKIITDVAEILNIDKALATTLLKHFHWRQERLLPAYIENASKVCQQAGALHPNDSNKPRHTGSGGSFCLICASDAIPPDDGSCLSLACGHVFCSECWDEFLSLKIKEGVCSITCPSHQCKVIVGQEFIQKRVSPETFEKFVRFLTHSYVADNPEVKWCPAPGCNNALTVDNCVHGIGICTCGFKMCWECLDEAHPPASCEQVKNWKKKCLDDSETQHWIMANTQTCPKCKSQIEKNGGCNHMICRQCKYEFCWVCLGDWKGHNNFYSCNRFETKKKSSKKKNQKQREQELLESKVALEKYLHYYHRYVNHERSRTFETQIRERATNTMQELRKTDDKYHDVRYIQEATTVLLDCRAVLKNSYVLVYYLPDGTGRKLFELLQSDLEKTTEMLSEKLELPTERINRVEIKNLSDLCALRVKNMLDAVQDNELLRNAGAIPSSALATTSLTTSTSALSSTLPPFDTSGN
ncbi:ubiquitin-protein ligase [Pelomyxa schiedti]|nr:ubiquitin-protein ligase [Pelomyxa schiedti]